MTHSRRIDIDSHIDNTPLSFFQITVILMCVIIVVLEGFDTQVIGFVAPSITQEWGISRASFGPAFSASLFGLMIGSLILGIAGDRFGRKTLTLLSFGFVGVFTLMTAYVDDMNQLILLRFLTGLGLGGTIPNAIALVSEYSSKRYRALSVTILSCGFPLGAVLGGFVAAPLISEFGWRSAFVLGGVLPIVLSFFLVFSLPESIRFLAGRNSKQQHASRLLKRIDPNYTPHINDVLFVEQAKGTTSRFVDIFTEGRLFGSLLLWSLFSLNLFVMYLMLNWLPTILTASGFDLSKAIIATSLFSAGGIVSGIAIGRVIDRTSPYLVLSLVYIFAAIIAVCMSMSGLSPRALLVLVFLAGVGMLGPQMALNALAANFYPSRMRSTGVGASLSMGRIGAILGPLTGGLLLSVGVEPTSIFQILTIPAIMCAIGVAVLGWRSKRSKPPLPIREFDHLMCGMKDVVHTGKTFEALGFTVGPITPLDGVGVTNVRILLSPKQDNLANYIEFMQLGGAKGDIPSYLQKWLQGSLKGKEGAHALIMRTDDAQNTFAHFQKRHEEDPQGGFSPVLLEMDLEQTGPDGELYPIGFSNCIFPDLEPPVYVSTSEIRTLDFYLNHKWRTHENGAYSWVASLAVSNTPTQTAEELQELWGGQVTQEDGKCMVTTPGEIPFKIFTPDAYKNEYGEASKKRLSANRGRPYIAGVHISVHNLDKTRVFLLAKNIKIIVKEGKVIIPAKSSHGLLICFEQEHNIGSI